MSIDTERKKTKYHCQLLKFLNSCFPQYILLLLITNGHRLYRLHEKKHSANSHFNTNKDLLLPNFYIKKTTQSVLSTKKK